MATPFDAPNDPRRPLRVGAAPPIMGPPLPGTNGTTEPGGQGPWPGPGGSSGTGTGSETTDEEGTTIPADNRALAFGVAAGALVLAFAFGRR